jgi:hypothetical protein
VTREHSDPVGQERGVRGVMNVSFDDGGVDAQATAAHDAALAPQGHQSDDHILEHGFIKKVGQSDQRLGVRDPLAIDAAKRAVDQAAPHLSLALIEAPVVEVLEDQHAQDDGCGRPQAASTPTLRMALSQRLGHAIHEDIVIEKSVDLAESGIPELVAVGQEHFHEAALPVRSPHHGASGEAAGLRGCTA